MRILTLIILILLSYATKGQQGFAFTRITTDDGSGLASNVVSSLYQDEKGYIWVGTDNGLQRFDGSKFIQFRSTKPGSDQLHYATVSQIIPADSGRLILAFASKREFGIFDPSTFIYKKLPLHSKEPIPARAEFRLWKDSKGDIYCNILQYGILHYSKKQKAFIDESPFSLPTGWILSLDGMYEDKVREQYWFACDKGICIYDRASRQTWYKDYNPNSIAILNDPRLSDQLTQIYIDKQRRTWVFGWPLWGNGGQYKFCFDSTGKFLAKDTAGLNQGTVGFTDYNNFFETKQGDLWIYGLGVLFNYDNNTNRFYNNKSDKENDNINIDYEVIYQVLEDRDGTIWFASDKGLYSTSVGGGDFNVVNIMFNKKEPTSITDILELPNGDIWLTSWGNGIRSINKFFQKTENYVYDHKPPSTWKNAYAGAAYLTWSISRQAATGNIWIGCNSGVIMVHNPVKRTTEYLHPPVFNNSTVRFIVEDSKGNMWFGTQGGRLIQYSNGEFVVMQDIGTIIYKVYFDSQGWIWLATHEKGLYAINPANGNILQHYTNDGGPKSLYSNTGNDIEQLNDSIIVLGAGALNFVNKRNGRVSILGFEDGLPSNTVRRLRKDQKGFLWIITSNGLCRYNPNNNRITPYGRKDGIVLAEQTTAADFVTSGNHIIFGGGNSLVMFDPGVFTSTQPPSGVTITDFKISNEYLPVDSLLRSQHIKLQHDQNAVSIYYASLSYKQRDKLTYYYKLEGIDKDWIRADRSYYVNYSSLPPGTYTFKIYCENIEGIRCVKTTELVIHIKAPFWRSWWFLSSLLFVVALLIYAVHDLRVNRILAVEKLRNRVARDLHDDMGSTLSTINILSSMAKTKMSVDPIRTTEYLSKISDNSQRMMEAMDDIVWSIKPSNDSMHKIAARMREFATEVLEAKDIELDFKVDEDVFEVKLNMEARRDFFLIFKEAVNNAAKYSKANVVQVHVIMQSKKLQLTVKDDGIGFKVGDADGGNGLGNMQKRADHINGLVTIKSKEGEGATITLAIPIA